MNKLHEWLQVLVTPQLHSRELFPGKKTNQSSELSVPRSLVLRLYQGEGAVGLLGWPAMDPRIIPGPCGPEPFGLRAPALVEGSIGPKGHRGWILTCAQQGGQRTD